MTNLRVVNCLDSFTISFLRTHLSSDRRYLKNYSVDMTQIVTCIFLGLLFCFSVKVLYFPAWINLVETMLYLLNEWMIESVNECFAVFLATFSCVMFCLFKVYVYLNIKCFVDDDDLLDWASWALWPNIWMDQLHKVHLQYCSYPLDGLAQNKHLNTVHAVLFSVGVWTHSIICF